MSQNKSTQCFKPLIRYNKNFVYKGKKYPIDFNHIINNSNYFYENRDEFVNIKDIQLAEELPNMSEESITCFIASCHNESFEINDSNVFSLNQLSIKYDVPKLTALTDDFIKKYGNSLIFQSIQNKIQLQIQNSNSFHLEKEEEFIASNFFNYVDNEQLLNLPISFLYRIINHPKLQINKLNETNKNQLIDFLFKCLDKRKREASILFLNLDVENPKIEIFSKLTNEYSDVFDFNMISPKFLMKTTTDLLSELSLLKQSYSNSISQVNQLLDQIKIEKQKQQDLVDSFKQFAQKQIKKENEKMNDSFQNLKKQIENEKQKHQVLVDSFKQFAQEQIKKENEKLNESFQNLKKQIENDNVISKSEADRKINEMKLLVDKNNSDSKYFITRDILNILFLLIKFAFMLFHLVLYQFFIEFL